MKKVIIFLLFMPLLAKIVFAHSAADLTIIHMSDQGFSPEKIEINKGDTVTFENKDKEAHWPASDIHPTHQIFPEFDPKRPVNPGESWSFKFDREGIWRMHDHLNPQITGAVTVREAELKSNQQSGFTFKINQFFENLKQFFKNIFKREDLVPVEKDSKELFIDDKKLYSYVKKFGPKQTTKQLSSLGPQFGDCHQTAHKAGRFAYEIYKDKAFEQCGAECHSGCYHGATEAYFRDHGTANLTQNLNVLCKSELNPFFSHQCIHGVGHGLMAWSDYQIQDALKSCDLLQSKQDSCWTGVFMENIVGALSEKDAKVKGNETHVSKYLNEDPQYPCTVVDEKYKSSCYFLQTSRMIQLFGADFKKVADACLQAPQIYQRVCFESMGRDVGGAKRGSPAGAIQECSHAPIGDLRIGCLVGAVQDSFWDPTGADEAISFCKLLTDEKEKQACYSTIFERAPQVLTSKKDLESFCNKVEGTYQSKCNETINKSY